MPATPESKYDADGNVGLNGSSIGFLPTLRQVLSRWADVAARQMTWLVDRLWGLGLRWPWLVLLPLYLLQTGLTLNARRLWFSDEVRYADALDSLISGGHWVVLYMNGEAYPDKPPLYFWLLAALSPFTGGVNERLFFLGAAVSGLALLAATVWLARSVALLEQPGPAADPAAAQAANPGSNALMTASGLALLATPFFAAMTHYSRMDLLFAALITASQTCFLRMMAAPDASPQSGRATCWPTLAFGLAGLATITKGPLGLALPLAGLLAYAATTGRWRRMAGRQMLRGVGVYVAIVGGWLAASLMVEGRGFIANILGHQVVARAMDAWHHREGWAYYLPVLPAAMLPWTLLPVAWIPRRIANLAETIAAAWARRSTAGGYLWCMFLAGFTLLNAISIKIPVYLLPLLPPVVVLAGRALLTPRQQASRFWVLAGGFLAVLALAAPFAQLLPLAPARLQGTWAVALLAGLGAWALWRLRHVAGPAPLVALAMAMTLIFLPMGLKTAPSLDAIMSPREQALHIKDWVAKGFAPASYRIYPGVYSYYAGTLVPELKDLDQMRAFLAEHPRTVAVMPEKRWRQWENPPQSLRVVHTQRIVGDNFVLLVQGE